MDLEANSFNRINGEQALALGALAAGVGMVASYPGSPGVGTMNALIEHSREHQVPYVHWCVNERVALEMCIGASMAGRRSLVCTKSVGMNVLLDPLMTLNLTGVHGGLMILLGDDPGAYGSQNEQDTRFLADLIEIPMWEPSSPGEAYIMMVEAFHLSEQFRTPIVIRITRSLGQAVEELRLDTNPYAATQLDMMRDAYRFVPYPGNAVEMHRNLHARLDEFEACMEDSEYNRIIGDGSLGILTGRFLFNKLLDAVGKLPNDDLRVLKLGTLYPLPRHLIKRFLGGCEKVLVLEESDGYLENALKAAGQEVGFMREILGKGSGHLPFGDELLRWQIQEALRELWAGFQPAEVYLESNQRQERPTKADHCAASPNEMIFELLEEVSEELEIDPILIADPGCWVKIAGELDGKFAIGSAVAVASGLVHSGVEERVVALYGDSAFFHSTISAICDAVYSQAEVLMILLDNHGAASTGFQPTPAVGADALGQPAPKLSISEIARACGVPRVRCIPSGASNDEIKKALRDGLVNKGLELLIIEVERG